MEQLVGLFHRPDDTQSSRGTIRWSPLCRVCPTSSNSPPATRTAKRSVASARTSGRPPQTVCHRNGRFGRTQNGRKWQQRRPRRTPGPRRLPLGRPQQWQQPRPLPEGPRPPPIGGYADRGTRPPTRVTGRVRPRATRAGRLR